MIQYFPIRSHIINTLIISFTLLPGMILNAEQLKTQTINSTTDIIDISSINAKQKEWFATIDQINPDSTTQYIIQNEKLTIDTNWLPVEVPGNLYGVLNNGNDLDKIWYIKTFRISRKPDTSLSIRLGKINDRDQVYLNGQLIGKTGQFGAELPQAYDKTRIYEIPHNVLHINKINVLLIHVETYNLDETGIASDRVELGPTSKMLTTFDWETYRELGLLIAYLTVGFYFLFLFIRRRVERENLFFALFVIILVGYQGIATQIRFRFDIAFITLKRIEYLLLYLLTPLFFYFIRTYYVLPDRLWKRILDILATLATFASFIIWMHVIFSDNANHWWYVQKNIAQQVWLVHIIGILIILVNRCLRRQKDAYYMLIGFVFIFSGIVLDSLSNRSIINLPRLLSFFFSAFIFNLALILANRFVRVHNQVEDLNKNLEAKVEKRTLELNKTLNKVQTLKEMQDGDYYLTSLLIKPLGGNFSTNELVDVQMLTHQKKKFKFRGHESEIGGDINIAHDITLRGRKYSVVLNGDAMGKSIQGAGGALVLGTVFKSIVNRTKLSSNLQNKFPEQWLRLGLSELQGVFVGFDGSMLISVVMGLVDEQSGMFYYINAEHPNVALYRNGHAQFVKKEIILRKIGIEILESGIHIQALQLAPGDIIFLGSDGRDDILLGKDKNGLRIINEDETAFLKHIEAGRGDLSAIEKSIIKTGELTDDLTLLRIEFRKDAPFPLSFKNIEADKISHTAYQLYKEGHTQKALDLLMKKLQEFVQNPALLRQLIQILVLEKKYTQVLPYIEQFSSQGLEDIDFLYYASSVYKRHKKYEMAADYGERCRLRDPSHLNNLANLIDVFRISGKLDRSKKLLAKGLKINPDHSLLKKVGAKINNFSQAI